MLGIRLVLRVFFRERREIGAGAFACFSTSSALAFTAASSLPSVLSRMWLARTCSGVVYCSMFSLYARSMSAGGTLTFARSASTSISRYLTLRFSGILKSAVCACEVSRDVGVGRRHVGPEAVGVERDHRELHLVVAPAVFLLELLVGHRDPFGERLPQLVDGQRAPHVVFELRRRQRRPLRGEQLLIALRADERAVLLKRRDRVNALRDFLVADLQAQAIGFRERGALVDHLLEDLLIDAELLQQLFVHVAAVRGAVRLQLRLIRPAEFVGANLFALDDGDRIAAGGVGAGAAQKIRNVKNYERQADETQAPFEPVSVPTHPVKHGHRGTSGNSDRMPECSGEARETRAIPVVYLP